MNKQLPKQFVGCWKLVSHEFRSGEDKVFHPFGENPIGTVINSENGRFSAQIMTQGRPAFASGHPTHEELKTAYNGYIAYFGTIEFNESEGIIINHVEGSLNPAWVGGDQIRHCEISGNLMILRTPLMKIGKYEMTGVLIWERVE